MAASASIKHKAPNGIYLIPVAINLNHVNQDAIRSIWQGVIFVRGTGPYCGGVFRFNLEFYQLNNSILSQYMNPQTIPKELMYGYFPILRLQSEIHTINNQHQQITNYCLKDIIASEQDNNKTTKNRFSCTLYVINRFKQWFDLPFHDSRLAQVDKQVSTSDTLLYRTLRNDPNERRINFVPDIEPDIVLDIQKIS